jgi:hypothetical protein
MKMYLFMHLEFHQVIKAKLPPLLQQMDESSEKLTKKLGAY